MFPFRFSLHFALLLTYISIFRLRASAGFASWFPNGIFWKSEFKQPKFDKIDGTILRSPSSRARHNSQEIVAVNSLLFPHIYNWKVVFTCFLFARWRLERDKRQYKVVSFTGIITLPLTKTMQRSWKMWSTTSKKLTVRSISYRSI